MGGGGGRGGYPVLEVLANVDISRGGTRYFGGMEPEGGV